MNQVEESLLRDFLGDLAKSKGKARETIIENIVTFVKKINVKHEDIPAHLIVGSAPPSGYIVWDEWAIAQINGGLKQSQCNCGLWLFPQEVKTHNHKP